MTMPSNFIGAATQEKRSSGFPTRSNTNQPVQSQKVARGWEFLDLESRGIVLSV